jgi:hypothetical protein
VTKDSLSTNLGKIAASVAGVEQAAKPIVDSMRAGWPIPATGRDTTRILSAAPAAAL